MYLDEVEMKVSEALASEPQKKELALAALEATRHGLGILASMGFPLDLTLGHQGRAVEEFPKMLYKGDTYCTVEDEVAEGLALADGWESRLEGEGKREDNGEEKAKTE